MGGNVNQTGGAVTPGFPTDSPVVDNTRPAGKPTDKPVRSIHSGSQLPKPEGKAKKQRRLRDYSVKKDNDSTLRRKAKGLIHRLVNITERTGAASVRQKALKLKGELQNLDYALRRFRQEQEGHPAGARKLANLGDASKYLKRQEGSLTVYTSKKTGAEFIPYDSQYAMELKPGMVLRTTYGDVLKQGSQLYCTTAKQRLSLVDNPAGKTVEIVRDDWRCNQPLAIERKYLQLQLARLNEKVLQLEGRQDKQHYPSGAVPIEPFEDRSRYQQVLFDDRPDIRVFVSRNTGKQYVAFDLHRVVPLKPDTITSTRYGDICISGSDPLSSEYVVSGKGEQLVREEGKLFAVELPDTDGINRHNTHRKQANKLPTPEMNRADQAPIQKEAITRRSPEQEKAPVRKQENEARKAPEKPLPKAVNSPDQLSSEKKTYSQGREEVKEQARPIAHSEPSQPAMTNPLRPRQEHTVERQKAKAPEATADQKSKAGSQPSGVPGVKSKKLTPNAGKKAPLRHDERKQQTAAQRTKPAVETRQKREADKPAVKRKAAQSPSDQPPLRQKKTMQRPSGARRVEDFASSGHRIVVGFEHFRFFQEEGSNRTYISYDDNWAVPLIPGHITSTRYGQVYLSQDGQPCLTGPGGRFYEKNGEILLETPSNQAPDIPAGSIPMDQMMNSTLFTTSNVVGEDLTLFKSGRTGKTYVSYDQKSAIEYKEGEIVHTRFGDFCNRDGSYYFAGKGSALIKRDGDVRKVKAALREVIPILKHKPVIQHLI